MQGSRTLEAPIHTLCKGRSPGSAPPVVAYAVAGTLRRDRTTEPLGTDRDGKPVMLSEIWPTPELVAKTVGGSEEGIACRRRDLFAAQFPDN